MKIIDAKIYILKIPFNFSFEHSLKKRLYSDTIIVELISDTGIIGYGEGIPREYVTGETLYGCADYIKKNILPNIIEKNIDDKMDNNSPFKLLDKINSFFICQPDKNNGIVFNSARSAVELALLDCLLKINNKSLNCVLPPKKQEVKYSGVITFGSLENTIKLAIFFKQLNIKFLKIKISNSGDIEKIAAAREILGESVSIRLDANCAFETDGAIEFCRLIEKYNIDCFEQPVKRGNTNSLLQIKLNSTIPLMVDESLVTIDDAKILIENKACDYFNLRISKCGGLYNILAIANLALENNIKIQIGCHVGETAVLSAAGRHLAAYLNEAEFVEGSYSNFLLKEDIASEQIKFGNNGAASLFTNNGLGVTVDTQILNKYSEIIKF